MRIHLHLASALFATSLAAFAQPPVAPPPPSFATLADQPATHTGVVFDRTMMQIAQGFLQSSGIDEKRAAVALTSISFDTYKYPQPAFYTPEAMAALAASYRAAGWKHLVDGNKKPADSAQPRAPITDLWMHFSGSDIDEVTVLIRAPKNMNVIQVAGDLRPLDLVHLGGHFGIPKVDPNAVMVPAPDNR